MRSLQDWMKYLEQQEQSLQEEPVKETPEREPEQVAQVTPVQEIVTPPATTDEQLVSTRPEPVIATAPTPAPVMPKPEVQVVETVVLPSTPELAVPESKPVEVKAAVAEPVTPAPAKPARVAPRTRKKQSDRPKAIAVPTPEETAQKSYRPFRETREELLQRLLDPLVTLEEAARILNVCPTTVRRYTNKGLLKHFRTAGNQRRFRLSDVLAFMGDDSPVQKISD